jgi:hypothetical protein
LAKEGLLIGKHKTFVSGSNNGAMMFAESIFCPCKSIKTTCLECKEREIDDKNFHLSNPFLFPTNMLLAIQTSSEWAIFAIFYEAEEKGVPWINTSSFVPRHQTAK